MVSLAGLMPFFLFPRVKSEAIVARREPKEEVEDVSSYLCTELVYYITKMPVGKGGLCTCSVVLHVSEMQADLPFVNHAAKLASCGLLLIDRCHDITSSSDFQTISWAKRSSRHGSSSMPWVVSVEQCPFLP